MIELLKADECMQLKGCINELNKHHNDVSLNFANTYPKHPVDDKIAGFINDVSCGKSKIGVIKDNNRIVGVCKIDLDLNKRKGVLDYLVVLKEYRKYGYGKQLMQFALNEFEINQIIEIEIHAVYGNKTVDFYKKNGFKIESMVLCKNEQINYKHAIMQTPHLYLRELSQDDFYTLKSIISNPENMKYYPKPYDDEGVQHWIDWNLQNYRDFGFGLWAVCLKENDVMIGDCGITIQRTDKKMIAEIGYHIHPDYQGKGYAKEAAAQVLKWGFATTPFNRFYSYCNKENIASLKTAQSIGMRPVYEYNEEQQRTIVSAISREEYDKL